MELGGFNLSNIVFKRIVAFIVDLALLSFIATGVSFIILSPESAIGLWLFNHFGNINSYLIIIFSFSFIGILKDIFNGSSVGKRILKLYIGNTITPIQPVKKYKLILRNLTYIIWPIEGILLLTIGKRLGDIITKTTVYSKEKNSYSPSLFKKPLNKTHINNYK